MDVKSHLKQLINMLLESVHLVIDKQQTGGCAMKLSELVTTTR